jgi:hypothetical protein
MNDKAKVFEQRRTEIIQLLYKLNAECQVLCERNPDDLNWAQIGDMGWMSNQLRELVERT